jgi:hypothetical protein
MKNFNKFELLIKTALFLVDNAVFLDGADFACISRKSSDDFESALMAILGKPELSDEKLYQLIDKESLDESKIDLELSELSAKIALERVFMSESELKIEKFLDACDTLYCEIFDYFPDPEDKDRKIIDSASNKSEFRMIDKSAITEFKEALSIYQN